MGVFTFAPMSKLNATPTRTLVFRSFLQAVRGVKVSSRIYVCILLAISTQSSLSIWPNLLSAAGHWRHSVPPEVYPALVSQPLPLRRPPSSAQAGEVWWILAAVSSQHLFCAEEWSRICEILKGRISYLEDWQISGGTRCCGGSIGQVAS